MGHWDWPELKGQNKNDGGKKKGRRLDELPGLSDANQQGRPSYALGSGVGPD
jgi:hypothetical protein